MGYLNIDNLYKAQEVLMFRECYAMEKIHGTSAHISYDPTTDKVTLFSGGASHEHFAKLFDTEKLRGIFAAKVIPHKITIFGEAYGGKMQGMGHTYGHALRFIVFDVKIGELWLNVPKAEAFAKDFGFEFVHYVRTPTDIDKLDAERDADSVQAVRNGCGEGHKHEGIVIRPLEEMRLNNGERVIAKYKGDSFKETSTPRVVGADTKILEDARAIATEWVTHERLNHIVTKGTIEPIIQNTGKIIEIMVDDILREGQGEIVDTPVARREIARTTALLFKDYLKMLLIPKV